MPNDHSMRLDDGPYMRIHAGAKDIELRVNDAKRRAVAVGDAIVFTRRSDPTCQMRVTVTELRHAPDFETLVGALPASRLGCAEADKTALISALNQSYGVDEIENFGVVGLGFQLEGTS